MPNWCANTAILKHEDPAMIARARAGAVAGLLNEFIPVPKPLMETVSGHMGNGYEQELNQFKMQLNLKYFGYKDWYDFCTGEWGTKWDVTGDAQDHDNGVMIVFDSAWAPPIAAYEKLVDMGFEVAAKYYEPGCAFVGEWVNGEDMLFEIQGNSDWVIDNIPEHLDEAFAISENMAQWEEENEEERE